jgi:beta-lactamase class A
MTGPPHLSAMDEVLAATLGTVSVWCGRPGVPPRYARLPDARHYAASMVKLAILVAAYRAVDRGELDLAAGIPVRNRFASALAGAPDFRLPPGRGGVWDHLGGEVPGRWLAEQMIVRSSNLAANLLLDRVGRGEVAGVWRLVGAAGSTLRRPVEDLAARTAGITNEVTAADLAALLTAIEAGAHGLPAAPPTDPATPPTDPAAWTVQARAAPGGAPTGPGGRSGPQPGPIASVASCRAMLATLCAQERREDLVAGLPAGTRVAVKNGWVTGVRHAAGLIYPADAAPYALVVCLTTPLAREPGAALPDPACRLVSQVAAASWADRGSLE